MKKPTLNKYQPTIFLIIFFFIFWELLIRIGNLNTRILPLPSQVIIALFTHWDSLYPHILQTAVEALIGFVVAAVLGFILAVILDLSPEIRRAIHPLLIVSQTIPIIALAPLLLLWFGFGLIPKIIVVTLYCFFPITIAGADGLSQTKKQFNKLLNSMKASYWQGLWLVRLPSSLPYFFSGLKIAATYSVAGAIVGEFVGAYQGLGVYMERAANSFSIDLVFASIFITVILSFFIFKLVTFFEHLFNF